MKVNDIENEDRHGRYFIKFTGVKSLQEIYDWLFQHYQGYKFGLVLDTNGEYKSVGNEYCIYFLDELTEEVMCYADYRKDGDNYVRR